MWKCVCRFVGAGDCGSGVRVLYFLGGKLGFGVSLRDVFC